MTLAASETFPEQAPTRWVPILGEFETTTDSIVFNGKRIAAYPENADAPKDQATAGVILSNREMSDGAISATVVFEEFDSQSVCEFAIAYDLNGEHILTAGIGGGWGHFGIREFFAKPAGPGWTEHRIGGTRTNVRPKVPYQIEVILRGGNITLKLDTVTVATATVPTATGSPRHVGFFCCGTHPIKITNFHLDSVKPRAFVVMKFSSEYDSVYRDVVHEICGHYDVHVLRADEMVGSGLIINDILRQIIEAQLIIADITPVDNANVYFEIGYAFALAKPMILLARRGTPLPFDVSAFRVLFYEDTIGGKKHLEEGLRRHIAAILSQ